MLRLYDLLRVGVRQVMRQMRRYLGVFLAITMGTAGFIVVITMGQEVKKTLNADLDLLGGATLVKVRFEEYVPNRDRFSKPPRFQPETINALKSTPGVLAVSATAAKSTWATSTWLNVRRSFALVAADGYFFQVNGLTPVSGKLFGVNAVNERSKIVVIGEELARRFFDTTNATGKVLLLDKDLYVVAGVLGGALAGDRVYSAFVPITTAQDRIEDLSPVDRLYVRCSSWDDVSKVADAIPGVVKAHQPADRLRVDVAWDPLKRVQRIAWWIEVFVYLAIVATLVLGGFGIWNGMMSAVQARTREIGLKKAMGAEDRDILIQFLIESLFLSSCSAVMGVVLGRISVEMMSSFLKCRPPEELFAVCVVMGIGFAILLGIGAGFYPSLRASRMEVVSAIRYE